MFTPLNMSRVTCHLSRVTCHMSHVTCLMSHVMFFCFFFLIKWRSLSVEGLLSTGPTPSSFVSLSSGCINCPPSNPYYRQGRKYKASSHTLSVALTVCLLMAGGTFFTDKQAFSYSKTGPSVGEPSLPARQS